MSRVESLFLKKTKTNKKSPPRLSTAVSPPVTVCDVSKRKNSVRSAINKRPAAVINGIYSLKGPGNTSHWSDTWRLRKKVSCQPSKGESLLEIDRTVNYDRKQPALKPLTSSQKKKGFFARYYIFFTFIL